MNRAPRPSRMLLVSCDFVPSGCYGVCTRCFPSELGLFGALVLFPHCLWLLTFCLAALGEKTGKLESASTTVGIWGSVLVYSEIVFQSGVVLQIVSLIRVGGGAISSVCRCVLLG